MKKMILKKHCSPGVNDKDKIILNIKVNLSNNFLNPIKPKPKTILNTVRNYYFHYL